MLKQLRLREVMKIVGGGGSEQMLRIKELWEGRR